MVPDDQMGNLQDLFNTNILNGGTGSSFHLYTNNVLLTPAIRSTDLAEATFDGYSALTALDAWIRRNDPVTGRPMSMLTDETVFICTGDTDVPQVVYGYYVLSDTGLLAAVEKLPTPITIHGNGDAFLCPTQIIWNASFQDNPGN